MKAVGVLFGFLGLSNLVFFYNPNNRKQEQSIWEDAYLYTNSILQSSQVSFIFRLRTSSGNLNMSKLTFFHIPVSNFLTKTNV